MSTETEKYWEIVINQLKAEGKFHPLSIEEAEKEYEMASDDPISKDIQDSIIERIMNKDKERYSFPVPPQLYSRNEANVDNSAFSQLNRNKGKDEDAEELLNKFYIGMLPKKATIYKYFGKYEYNNCIHYTMGRFFISVKK